MLLICISILIWDAFVGCNEDSGLLSSSLDALHKLLTSASDDLDNINVDALFGLLIARDLLFSVCKKPLMLVAANITNVNSSSTKRSLRAIKSKLRSITEKSVHSIKSREPDYFNRFRPILSSRFANRQWHELSLAGVDDCSNVNYALAGRCLEAWLDEDQSDACISQLFNMTVNISEDCKQLMRADDDPESAKSDENECRSGGYRLTHQLLYHQIAYTMNRTTDIIDKSSDGTVESMFLDYAFKLCCGPILEEIAQTLAEETVPCPDRDLLVEQTMLCALHGGSQEFLPDRLMQMVHSWQHWSGCYKGDDDSCSSTSHMSSIQVLSSVRMKHGCSSHMTGITGALLATHIASFCRNREQP